MKRSAATRGPKRAGRPAGPVIGLLAAVVLASASPAEAASLGRFFFGQVPDSAGTRTHYSIGGLDTLDVAREASTGYFFLEDLAARLAGAAVATTGVETVARPIDLTGAGWGRTPITLDGQPLGGRVVRWGNDFGLPLLALDHFEARRAPDAGDAAVGGGGGISLSTRVPVQRPHSSVALMGGTFGYRVSEMDFGRTYGRVGFQADVADVKSLGFGDFGTTRGQRGYIRLTFPVGGARVAASGLFSTNDVDLMSQNFREGQETTKEQRWTVAVDGGMAGGTLKLALLRDSGRLETGDGVADPFELFDRRWRVAGNWISGDSAAAHVELGAAGERESVSGVLDPSRHWTSVEGTVGGTVPLPGSARGRARLGVARRNPTGLSVEPSVRLWRRLGPRGEFWVCGGRTADIPGLLVHLDQARPERAALETALTRLQDLGRSESCWSAEAGAKAGGRLRVEVVAGGTRTLGGLGTLFLSGAGDAAPLLDPRDEWIGRADLSVAWRPRPDLILSVFGGWRSFDRARHPYEPEVSGEGTITLVRDYFERDLHLSATLVGRLLGRRGVPGGAEYPALLTGGVVLTGEIRTLTLFWRFENTANVAVESDLRSAGQPILLPGYYNRIGATLRLLD